MVLRRHIRIVLFILVTLACLASLSVSALGVSSDGQGTSNQTDKYRVLFLSSYSMSDEIVQEQIKGLQSAISVEQVDISYEFMDARHFSSDYDFSILYRYLKNKLYRNGNYDCCIIGDDEALSFLLDRPDLISNTPAVYLGVQDEALAERANKTGYMTGIMERFEYEANLDVLKALMPEVTTIHYILDNSKVGTYDATNLARVVAQNPQYSFDILNMSELSEAQLDDALDNAASDSVIFLGDLYLEKNGTVNTYSYKANEIAERASVPCFNIALDATDGSVLGGVVYDSAYAAQCAGKMTMQLLHGAHVDSIAPTATSVTASVFDQKVLDRYGLDTQALPAGTKLVNAETGTTESYRQQVLVVVAVILTLLLIVVVLARRTREQSQLIMTDEKVFRQTALEGNDFIALVSAKDRMFMLRSGSYLERGREVPEEGVRLPYDRIIQIFANYYSDDKTRDEFLGEIGLDSVRSRLVDASEVHMIFDFTDSAGTVKRKQFNFSWIDAAAGIILMSRTDITKSLEEEQQRNRELRAAMQAAEHANEAKSQFVSRISHDIRTPIGAILNLTDFAQTDIGDSKRLTYDLDGIATSGRFLLSLINDVLDISKIDSEKIEMNPSPYALDDFISEIRNIIGPMCEEKGLEYVVNVANAEVPVVMIDRIRLNQIMLNLLSNAVKYTPRGGLITFTGASWRLDDQNAMANIEVADTGIGMSEQFQLVMLDEFSQEEDNPQREKGMSGTGLGLSIVKRLVDLMGGTIDVISAPGEGTRITIWIPVRIADATVVSKEEAGSQAGYADTLAGKVLLAEDNAINASIAQRIFTELGIEVDVAGNGREELVLFEKSAMGEYLAVFTDIQMPVMNGYDAARAIRALDRADAARVPIIAMTADAFSSAIEKAWEAGMTKFITKPLKVDEIRAILVNISA